jgi:hypothetical protein
VEPIIAVLHRVTGLSQRHPSMIKAEAKDAARSETAHVRQTAETQHPKVAFDSASSQPPRAQILRNPGSPRRDALDPGRRSEARRHNDTARRLHLMRLTDTDLVSDTTAAGDTFSGALAVALTEGQPLEQAVQFANAAAAISVTRVGAQTSHPHGNQSTRFYGGISEWRKAHESLVYTNVMHLRLI